MEDVKKKNKIMILIASIILVILAVTCVILIIAIKNKEKSLPVISSDVIEKSNEDSEEVKVYEEPKVEEIVKKDTKVDIIDINSNSRPYMVVVNNTPVAVQVQEGLNRAYIVYEIPTEGNTSRLLALFKDIEDDLVIGTIRSARHNFIDFAFESDAIFCCWGWSFIAESQLRSNIIDYHQGLWGYPFYRDNKEGLALEHTAYTSMAKLKDKTASNGYRTTTLNKTLLNYDTEDVDISKGNYSKIANNVTISYGASPNITSFTYDSNTKMYVRKEAGNVCIDHNTKEQVTTKNIIVERVEYKLAQGDYYWDLKTVGSGEGYYITNGYALPITWSKADRGQKTKYTYSSGVTIDGKDVSGQEIMVSDGRTYIEVQTTSQPLIIE